MNVKSATPSCELLIMGQTEPVVKRHHTSQLAEKCIVVHEVSGHDFSRAKNAAK
jgi:hypothetical protein